MPKTKADVMIGKFGILATYTYAKAHVDGFSQSDAKERGMVTAIMGAKAKIGHVTATHTDYQADKNSAEKNKKTTKVRPNCGPERHFFKP